MAAQYSFVMKGLTKAFPGSKPILNGIHLQFYHDAKIGIVGPNGVGQVDADEDHGRPRQGVHRRGLAGRGDHRRLSRAGTAARSEQDGPRECEGRGAPRCRHARPVQRHLRANGRPRRRFRRADGRDGRTPGEDRRGRRLDARQPARDRDGRAALPAWRVFGRESVGRREAPGRADPVAAREAQHPAARRADQPPRRRERPVARKASHRLSRQRHPRHPRPLFPRQCRQLDPGARSRALLRLRRKLLHLSGKEGETPCPGRAGGSRQAEGDQRRARMDPPLTQSSPGQIQGADQGLRPARPGAGESRTRPRAKS